MTALSGSHEHDLRVAEPEKFFDWRYRARECRQLAAHTIIALVGTGLA